MAKVLCTATHPIDIDDGRTLAPGDVAKDVDVNHPHQQGLIDDGNLLVLVEERPHTKHEEKKPEAGQPDEKNKKE